MLRRFTFLLLLTFLLAPTVASAQPPLTAKAAPRTVTIQVAFVSASVADVNNLGINFDFIPVSTPIKPADGDEVPTIPRYFQFSTEKIVGQLYQTVTRARGKVIFATPVTIADNTAAAVLVDADVPEFASAVQFNGQSSFPKLVGSIKIRGTLTLTPHIQPNNTVSFEMASLVEGAKPIQLRAVTSGEPMVIIPSGPSGSGVPLIGNLFRTRMRDLEKDELLIFITPTLQPEVAAPKTVSIDVAGVKLQTVVNMLGRQTGIEAVVREGDKPFSLVNINLNGATLAQALRVIALSAGAVVTRNEDGVYVFRQADAAPDPSF